MKVLIVFNHPAPYKVDLFNMLAKDIDLDVIFERKKASDRPDDFYSKNEYHFNAIFLKHGAFSRENSNTGELKRYLKKHYNEYDLVIMNGWSTLTEMRALSYLKRHHLPYVFYINGGVIKKESKIKYLIKKHYIYGAFSYFSPSKVANEYLMHYGVKEENINLYHYSTIKDNDVLDKPLTKEEKEYYRKKYHLPEGRLFISACQFIPRKNNLFLLECFKGLKEQLILIGDGPEKELYERYIKDNKMDNVTLLPFMKQEELFEYFKGADFFITLSKEDIYGHTINEAMAKGLPVIASDKIVAALELIKNNVNGFVLPLDNKKSIINAITNIDTQLSINAINKAKGQTLETTAKDHIEIFKRVKEKK